MLDEVAGEDVAAMLGLPPSQVAVLLHRAKQNLRSSMLSAGYQPRSRTSHPPGATAPRRVVPSGGSRRTDVTPEGRVLVRLDSHA
jgi:hypothetical protein